MPLPKSSSVAAKATEVYSEVWSVILQQLWSMPPTREDDLTDLSQLLPYLRQLLTCCACAGLLEDAMISLSCGHCYCSECQFRDPLLKIQCRQCRDRTGLVVETQLRVVVKCYRHMCSVLADKVKNDPVIFKSLLCLEENSEDSMACEDVEKKENEKPSKKNSRKVTCRSTIPNVNTNPILEILREIQEGEKVSRAVLVIKPPQKYLTPKLVTPKKEPPPQVAKPSRPKRVLKLDLKTPVREKATLTSQEKKGNTLHTATLISHRLSSLKSSRKRKSLISTHSLSTPKEPSPKKRRRVVKRVNDSKPETGTEEGEDMDVLSMSDVAKSQVTEVDMLQAKLVLDAFHPDNFSVSLSCLNEQYVEVSPGSVQFTQSNNIDEYCAKELCGDFHPDTLKFKKSSDGSVRERIWDQMCPRLRARRSRAIIDKTITQQVKSARGAIKSKSKEIKTPKLPSPPKPPPPTVFTPPIAPPSMEPEYEPPLPDDLSGLVLEKLEGEDPLPYIDRLLFRPQPMYPHPPFHHLPPPPPPHFVPGQPPLFSPMHHHEARFPLMMGPFPPQLKLPPLPNIPKPPKNVTKTPSTPKKRKTPGYSEDGWRCRCGTNNVMFPEKVCAKGKCPCFSKGIPCKNCLCKHCHNPNNK